VKHLSDDQIDDLRAELEGQLAKLARSMKVTDEALRPVELDQTAVGRLSRIDSLQNQGLTRNLREREQVKLALLQEALVRLETGTYGLCTQCSGEMPFFPETPTCGACVA